MFQCPEVQLRQRQGRGEQPAQARSVSEASESLPWMLDRLDQASLPLDNTYSYHSNGTGVDGQCCVRGTHKPTSVVVSTCRPASCLPPPTPFTRHDAVYVIDSGVDPATVDLASVEVVQGWTAFAGDTSDCYGHGSAVASLVAGAVFGVAKAARVVSVKVLDCNGQGTLVSLLSGTAVGQRAPCQRSCYTHRFRM